MQSAVRLTLMRSIDAHDEVAGASFASFEALCREGIGPHVVAESRDAVPFVSPLVLKDPSRGRSDANVAGFGRWMILDIDKAAEEQVLAAWQALEERKWSRLLYSSYNHGRAKPKDPPNAGTSRVRLLVGLDREVAPHEWLPLWDRINAICGNIADRNCRKLSQPYYLPSCPPGTDPLWQLAVEDDAPVAALLAEEAAPAQRATLMRRVSVFELEDLAARLRCSSTSHARRMVGQALRRALSGEPLAVHGERDDTLFQVCATIADRIPDADPDSIGQALAPGLAAMSDAAQTFTAEDAADKVRRCHAAKEAREAQEKAEKAEKRRTERERRIAEATAGRRDREASTEEVATFAQAQGVTDARHAKLFRMRNRWAFLYRLDGKIDPDAVAECDLVAFAKERLAVFPWFDAKTEMRDGDMRDKTVAELREEYGGTFTTVVYDVAAETSDFNDRTGELVLAATPLRVKPMYSEIVDRLLDALDETGKLRDWLAGAADQRYPTSCLALTGDRNTGKTMISRGLSRLRTAGAPAKFDALASNFNSSVRDSGGWIEADETMGEAYHRYGSTFLRSHLSVREREINEKYKPLISLRGCLRIVVLANNEDILRTRETLTSRDSAALAERVLHVPLGQRAIEYVAKIRKELGPEGVDALVHKDLIAGHALWLMENHTYTRGARFLVEGNDTSLHARTRAKQGHRGAVVSWLLHYLDNPKKVDALKRYMVRVRDGALLAMASGIALDWKHYDETPPLSASQINEALEGISDGLVRLPRAKLDKELRTYHRVSTRVLLESLDVIGLDEDALHKILAVNTEQRPGGEDLPPWAGDDDIPF